ncbi:MAG: nucleotide exchange factor GrpE [Candidatus Saccharibacteria bacterium]|nr:nucleotide exchange factor GrpE [Candidatus Saccharibacteria bacterium]
MTKETKDNLNKKDTKETANTSDKNPEVIELTNDIKRIRADFENYRKRTELDIESARRNGGDAMILKLLPVIDTLERAISHIPSDIAENSWVKGVSGVAKNLNKTLKSIDVVRIDAKPGQEFNPELHYAVQVDEDASGEHEIISEELQAGYMRNGVVLRHTMVKVTRK